MDIVVIMDPAAKVKWFGDTSFALMLSAQDRGHRVFHCLIGDVSLVERRVRARIRPAMMTDEVHPPIELGDPIEVDLGAVDVVLVRVDPPFDPRYLALTLMLEHLRGHTLIVNDPRGLREANEKLYACHFPELMPPTVVTANRDLLLEFARQHDGAVLKPLSGHGGGRGVVALQPGDRNERAIVDQMTDRGRRQVMAQKFLDAVYEGDERIVLLDGEPLGVLLRTPTSGDFRANIGVGGTVTLVEMTDLHRRIAESMSQRLRADGLWFVGIDVIGGRLSEVNVTNPTGIRHLARLTGTRPDHAVIEWIENTVS